MEEVIGLVMQFREAIEIARYVTLVTSSKNSGKYLSWYLASVINSLP